VELGGVVFRVKAGKKSLEPQTRVFGKPSEFSSLAVSTLLPLYAWGRVRAVRAEGG